ncbi:hypothetical protein SOQ14_11610 [Erythrobacter sp. T5W1-R]|uniref:hypothetical protein n=1 Tax=Erythrobacter sp. T5W1-R TaxID=3101752 RepID=UPI002AFE3E5E|nr:hypothetical protein [Erythrobacter sp. T5W1-R]MEA1619564.1 hypothetical protein [Erythrobacter sp. T5W1-R]
MNEWSQGQMISLVAMVGWLILVVSGFASYWLGARQIVGMALVWAAIFLGAFVVVLLLM